MPLLLTAVSVFKRDLPPAPQPPLSSATCCSLQGHILHLHDKEGRKSHPGVQAARANLCHFHVERSWTTSMTATCCSIQGGQITRGHWCRQTRRIRGDWRWSTHKGVRPWPVMRANSNLVISPENSCTYIDSDLRLRLRTFSRCNDLLFFEMQQPPILREATTSCSSPHSSPSDDKNWHHNQHAQLTINAPLQVKAIHPKPGCTYKATRAKSS